MDNQNNLEETGNILNLEGMILGLFTHGDRYYLASYLKNQDADLYYSVDKIDLLKYIKGNITIEELFDLSSDYFEIGKRNIVGASRPKEELKPLISMGNAYYNQLSDAYKYPELEQQILNNEI